MEANNAFEETCGWIAAVITLCFFLSYIMPFIELIKGKLSFEEISGFYLGIVYVNCLCWYIYGDFLYSDCIKHIYLFGTISNFILMFIYLFYELKKYRTDAILNGLIILSGTYMIYLVLAIIIDNVDIIAKVCFGTYSLLLLYPIFTIYQVINEKDYSLIPIYSSCASFMASLCWVIYGYGITENYIIYPHSIIVILSAIQITIYINYKKRYPISIDKESSTIGIEHIENEEIKREEKYDTINKLDDESQPSISEKPVKIVEKIEN